MPKLLWELQTIVCDICRERPYKKVIEITVGRWIGVCSECEPKKEVKKPLRMYSKNPVLNQILNETTVKIPTDSMVAMDGEVEVNKSGINIEKTLPSVFNKDYSQLLKVVDEKVKSRRG